MEKKIFAIKIEVDTLGGVTREGTGVPHQNKSRFCEYYLPFFGTEEEAKAAALGLGQGCERQAKKFYANGWKTISLDGEILIDGAF